ncbi:MAG: 50S ribosomal protein L5 [Simkaniaceae bacterium]|nr:50S ribosomal protein L5 [Simkaniaceae bacterium]
MSRLKKRYHSEIKQELFKQFSFNNVMKIPELVKIVINMGVGEAINDKGILQVCIKELTLISGQKPLVRNAKKSVANFKLREGQSIGLKVTLRNKRMYDFFDRFSNIVSPRIRDFRGFNLKGDGRGNYSLGLTDQQMFPEINLDEVKRDQGMNVTFVTTANTDEECFALLKQLGLPFKHKQENT